MSEITFGSWEPRCRPIFSDFDELAAAILFGVVIIIGLSIFALSGAWLVIAVCSDSLDQS